MSNTNKRHPHAALIHAWADGAEIQHFDTSAMQWKDCKEPNWFIQSQYRIKPEANEPWKPKLGDEYYAIYISFGEIEIACNKWNNDLVDNKRYSKGNCFKTKKEAKQAAERVEASLKGELKGTTDVSDNVGTNVDSKIVRKLERKYKNVCTKLKEVEEELESRKELATRQKAQMKILIDHPELDDKPITDGEIALIRALRNAKISDIYPYDNSVIVYKDDEGELITDGYPVAFSIAITAGGRSALLESLSATCTALNQIRKEQEACNEA